MNLLHLITYIILYSFAGWILESVSKTAEQKKLVNSGFLYGPFCPIYGFGAIIMILCLSSLKENPVVLVIVSFFILTIWEYIVGVILEKIFKTKYWDYSHLKFNIRGRVCLKNSLYWGILGLLFIKYIHPFIESYILLIPNSLLFYVNTIILIAIIVDLIISSISISNFDTTISKLNELGNTIKEKVEELKNIKVKEKLKSGITEKTNIESIEKIIKDLKYKQNKLKIKIYKQANRLKKAFPSMKSESITQFLNQKIDLQKLKESIKKKNKE